MSFTSEFCKRKQSRNKKTNKKVGHNDQRETAEFFGQNTILILKYVLKRTEGRKKGDKNICNNLYFACISYEWYSFECPSDAYQIGFAYRESRRFIVRGSHGSVMTTN